jgi:hypothetical protein
MTYKSTKAIKKRCDTAFSLLIRRHGKCQFAGLDKVHCGGILNCAHIESRGNLRLRFDQQNALCICARHHVYSTYHPTAFNDLVAEFFPSQWKYVQEHKHERLNMTYQDYENLLVQLQEAL